MGARIVGDKSPNDLSYFEILFQASLLPDGCKITHLVRDVRYVMRSLSRCTWHTWRRGNIKVANSWAMMNANLHALCKDYPVYPLLRDEDLLEQPEEMLGRMRVPRRWLRGADAALRTDGLWPQPSAHHANLGKPLLADRRFAWRNDPERTELAAGLVGIEDEVLTLFGYEPRSATVGRAD